MLVGDDDPPPLSSLPEQLQAFSLNSQTNDTEVALPVARVTVTKAITKDLGLKRGFFSSTKQAKGTKADGKKKGSKGSSLQEAMPFIKANNTGPHKPSVSEKFILPKDEVECKLEDVKKQLVNVLKPTPEVMKSITSDNQLLEGFDDPEVMMAVNDVAANPDNFKNYQHNPKVMKFYQHMAKFAGQQLQTVGSTTQTR